MNRGWMIALALLPGLLLGPLGCETMREHRVLTGTAIGTGAGALAGGVIGHQSGHATGGAVIGAAAGALLGGGIGYFLDRQEQKYRQIQGVQVERAPAGPEVMGPPPAPAAPPVVQNVPEHLTLRLNSEVLFRRGASDLTPEGTRKIAEIAQTLKDYPQSDVIVKGYTSVEGGDVYNMDLSKRRADVVRNTLVANYVAPERIIALGMGSSNPLASNDTESGRMQNRRVEIDVIPRENVR